MVSEASFFIYKSVLSHAMLLSEGLNEIMMTQTRVRICVCQHNMNTPPRVVSCRVVSCVLSSDFILNFEGQTE